jgi:hypothetical protein
MFWQPQYSSDNNKSGMDLLGGGVHLPSPGQRGGRGGGLFFMIKQNIIRGKMRYSNWSNNMIISEL